MTAEEMVIARGPSLFAELTQWTAHSLSMEAAPAAALLIALAFALPLIALLLVGMRSEQREQVVVCRGATLRQVGTARYIHRDRPASGQ